MSNQVIVVSFDGDNIQLQTEPDGRGALPFDRDDVLNHIETFIGRRKVYLRPLAELPPQAAIADSLPAAIARPFKFLSVDRESDDCSKCGRLMLPEHRGEYCPHCESEFAGFRR